MKVVPLALCLEDLDARSDHERYLCCTAVPGRQPGLRITDSGEVVWKIDEHVALELWVTADDRLALYRLNSAPQVFVERAERRLEVPADKPVIVIEGDVVRLAGRAYRVFVHGSAERVEPPRFYRAAVAAGFAVAVAVGGAAACRSPAVEVRQTPPAVVASPVTSVAPNSSTDLASATSSSATPLAPQPSSAASTQRVRPAPSAAPVQTAIEVRHHPPAPPMPLDQKKK